MQAQMQGMSRKNKITVPFYSPPSRMYGQTPAEIIKEARAAVMSTSSVGIRPVFTSRPFTPKERERTLFGNVKKRSGRPPSSFSLMNVQNEEPESHVKLPSIEVATKRRTFPTFRCFNNLSLDNLTEDYEAEAQEEKGDIITEKLPKWKKSHSCPKEGRMVKAQSFNELSYRSLVQENSKWENFGEDQKEKSFELIKTNFSNSSKKSDGSREEINSSIYDVFGDSIKEEQPSLHSPNDYRYLNMTRGGGDFEELKIIEENLFIQKKDTRELKNLPRSESELDFAPEKTESSQRKETEKSKLEKNETKISKREISQAKQIKAQEFNVESIKLDKERDKNLNEKSKLKEKKSSKRESLVEKCIATDNKSDYLTAIKEGYKSSHAVTCDDSMPLEILELYETARYYGVDVDESNLHAKDSSVVVNNSKNSSVSNPGNLSNEKPKTIENSEGNILSREEKDFREKMTEKNSKKKNEKQAVNDEFEFVMNNKKRYHKIGEKGNEKERAYQKWNENQDTCKYFRPKASEESYDLFWENSYFKTQDDSSQLNESKNSKEVTDLQTLKQLISKTAGLLKKGAENQDVYETISQLYRLMKNSNLVLDGTVKSSILKTMYLYADDENPEILLGMARILLHLKVESCLPVAFKMIFKVARSDTNDHLFLNEEDVLDLFLDGIGRSSPLENAESCIYGYGALKFLTMNYNILSRILHMGALDLIALHLKMINSAHIENGTVEEQTKHALYQLTGALRHIAAGEGALPMFLTTNCITSLCKSLQLLQKDDDIVTNISRTLSLLSADEDVTQVLMSVENILTTITELLERYKENDKILIRLSYCLGNIVEHSDFARVQLSRNEASLKTILDVLKFYIDKDLELSMKNYSGNDHEELNPETVDDIIVKVIRIVANMSMNPIVGSNLSPAANEKKSLKLSKLLSVLLMRKDPGITLLATLGCLNNISYYCNTHSALIDITQGVERVLGLPSEDCQAEAARVLGNLTRHREIRDLIYNTGGVNQLMKLLSSQDREVVRCACGALVNMMLDSETRKHFIEAHGIDKLVKALELSSGDWSLASLAARAIWNSCADELSSAMSHNNMDNLLNVLATSLGEYQEENWNDGDVAWEEFASIATDLLEKINAHLEST